LLGYKDAIERRRDGESDLLGVKARRHVSCALARLWSEPIELEVPALAVDAA